MTRACCAPAAPALLEQASPFRQLVLAPASLLHSIPFFPCTPPPFSALTHSWPPAHSGRRRWPACNLYAVGAGTGDAAQSRGRVDSQDECRGWLRRGWLLSAATHASCGAHCSITGPPQAHCSVEGGCAARSGPSSCNCCSFAPSLLRGAQQGGMGWLQSRAAGSWLIARAARRQPRAAA